MKFSILDLFAVTTMVGVVLWSAKIVANSLQIIFDGPALPWEMFR